MAFLDFLAPVVDRSASGSNSQRGTPTVESAGGQGDAGSVLYFISGLAGDVSRVANSFKGQPAAQSTTPKANDTRKSLADYSPLLLAAAAVGALVWFMRK